MKIHLIWLIGWMAVPAEGGLTDFLPNFIDYEQLIKAATDTCEMLPLHILFSQQLSPGRAPLLQYSSEQPGAAGVAIYVPGWWNRPGDESSRAIVGALLNKYSTVMLLDTSRAFCRGYLAAASRAPPLARQLYNTIRNMMGQGMPLESVHIVGFSLGAHVAGMTGRLLQKNMNRMVPRITALDPARPCFTGGAGAWRVGRADAGFVHVIHTSAVLGLDQPLGHADLYVRARKLCQGARSMLECEHAASWRLFAASIPPPSPHNPAATRPPRAPLAAPRCLTRRQLRDRACTGDVEVMGDSTDNSTRGLFLFSSKIPMPQIMEKNAKSSIVFNALNPSTWFAS